MLSPTIFQAFSVEVKRPFPTILLMILIIEFFAQVFQQGSKDVLKYIYVMDENKPTFFSTSLSCLWSDSILSMAILKVTGLPSAKSEYWLESWELDATNRHRSLKANGCTVNTLCNYSQGRGKGGGGWSQRGRRRPPVQIINLSYTNFYRNRYPCHIHKTKSCMSLSYTPKIAKYCPALFIFPGGKRNLCVVISVMKSAQFLPPFLTIGFNC